MVKKKLLKAKHHIFKKWQKRSDYTAFLSVQEYQTMDNHVKQTEKNVRKKMKDPLKNLPTQRMDDSSDNKSEEGLKVVSQLDDQEPKSEDGQESIET